MSRLNKTIREGIIENALKASGYNARNDALIQRRAKLADDVRIFALGGTEQMNLNEKKFNKIKKLAKEKIKGYSASIEPLRDYEIYCNFAGRQVNLFFSGMKEYDRDKNKHVSPTIGGRIPISVDNPLNTEFDAVELEQRTINDLKTHVMAEVKAMVNSVTTIKKLLEIWPEAKELLPAEQAEQSTALVADVNKLNTMIGLPS